MADSPDFDTLEAVDELPDFETLKPHNGDEGGFHIAPGEKPVTQLGTLEILSHPLAKFAKPSADAIGRILSGPAAIARDWMEARSDEKPPSKILEAVARSAPSDKAIDIATGIEHAGQDTLEFFSSPLGISTLGIGTLPKLAQRGIALAFAAQMASQTPEIARQLGEELGKPEDQRDYNKIAELTTSGMANAGFAGLGAAHGLAPTRAVPPPEFMRGHPNIPVEKPGLAETMRVSSEQPITEGAPNAVQERSTTPIPVGETPGGGQEVGARVPGPEEPTGAQVSEEAQAQPEAVREAQVAEHPGEAAAKDLGLNWKGEVQGLWQFDVIDPKDNQPITFAVKAGTSPEGIKAKADAKLADFSESKPLGETTAPIGKEAGDILSMPADKFFDTADRWSKESMAGKSTLNPQRRAGKIALENPDLPAWEQAYKDASNEAERIRNEIKADPKSMMDRQKEMMGAGQKAQFFSEGIKALKGANVDKFVPIEERGKKETPAAVTPQGQTPTTSKTIVPENAPVVKTVDAIDDFLTRAIESTAPGRVLGGADVNLGLLKLPVWLAQEAANGTLRVVRATYRASKNAAHAIEAGLEWLRDQKLSGFNESEAKDWLSGSLKQEGGDVTGIAQRVREKVALAGQEELAPTGEGISAPESVENGERLLAQDPTAADKAMEAFESDPKKAVSAEGLAVVRAKLRQLAYEARRAEEQLGTNSPQYKAAWEARSEWAKRIKPMQTEWHKTGMAQQGEQDIDTGTFTGLREAYTDDTGKDFTPQQATKAKQVAGKVQKAGNSYGTAKGVLMDHLTKESGGIPGAEKRAFNAAKKAVRENAIRLADAENKTRLAKTDSERATAKVQEDAARKALDAANEVVKREAKNLADAENAARIKAASERPPNDQEIAAKRALDAAHKAVRENAVRLADAENKSRLADNDRDRATVKVQEDAARKALDAANEVAKREAKRLADAENAARVKEAARRPNTEQEKAAQRALKAAQETVRKATIDVAKNESKARMARAGAEKDAAQVQAEASRKALEAANERVRQIAIDRAKAEVEARVSPEKRVWQKVGEYIDKGVDNFDEIRNKVATDLGMSVKQVTDLINKKPRTKFLADDVWRKQETLRRFQQQARRWLKSTALPGYQRALATIPRGMFALKVGFHGTVALGTHAPMVAFQPKFWSTYIRDFGKMYKMVGLLTPKGQSRAVPYYEMQVQDLLRRKNYITARRAGLVNDPHSYEDYNSPAVSQYFGKLTGMGNRGYSVLKILRQDMFDQHWDTLPQTLKSPDMAAAISDAVNHATGVVKAAAPRGANLALFAPRLEASRAMWLIGDPMRAADTFLRWKESTPAEKHFAVSQVKEKAWVAGTMLSLLALNQGFLTAIGSDQKVNFTDPFRSDFLKFKAGGMTGSFGNAMISMARLPLRLWVGIKNEGKLNKIIYEDENTARTLFTYARSQASPFMGFMLDMAFGRNFEERPLPRAGFGTLPGKTQIPRRLREQGIRPFTWPEYASQEFSPIPLQEALKEVWKTGLGASDKQLSEFARAAATISLMLGTGGRVTEDTEPKKR